MIKLERDIYPKLKITDLLRYQGICGYDFKVKNKKRFAAYILDVKTNAYNFAKSINIKSATVYYSGLKIKEAINLLQFPCVLKPTHEASGKGVLICYSQNKIIYLNNRREIRSLSDLELFCTDLLTRKVVRKDSWMCEKLLLNDNNIARDIKFYIFYGKVGLILESQRIPKVMRCWRDENLNFVKTGKYDDLLYEANDIPSDLIDRAKDISLKIPVPFIRIDFLVTPEEYYLGEFTPAPERYWTFNEEWDEKLGMYYQNAVLRLINDVGYGKKFSDYCAFLSKYKIL